LFGEEIQANAKYIPWTVSPDMRIKKESCGGWKDLRINLKIFIVHGEEEASREISKKLKKS